MQLRAAKDGVLLHTFVGHNVTVTALAFSADGRLLASGDIAKVYLWNASSGAIANDLGDGTGGGEALAFSPDGQMLATGGSDGQVRIWSTAEGKLLHLLQGHKAAWYSGSARREGVISLAFSDDGQRLIVGNDDNTVQQWDTSDGHVVSIVQGFDRDDSPFSPPMGFLAVGPDGNLFASTFVGFVRVYVWRQLQTDEQIDRRTDGMLGSRLVTEWEGNVTDIWSLAFAPDGQLMASGEGRREGDSAGAARAENMAIYIWRVVDGSECVKLTGHSGSIRTLSWRSDGNLLASGSDDGTLRLWRLQCGGLDQ
ncbi:MAG: WD40 repeat domain-containing protein [Chloroflexota bacterium]|nr:WD40 repeat domain-containing protein [Chloroflexota bacterium]